MTAGHKKPAAKPAITMTGVTSSSLTAHGYDAATKTLAVTFKNGQTWHYHDVPPLVASGLATSKSVGSYFAASVRGKFKETRQ